MGRYIIRRILYSIPVLLIASIVVFAIITKVFPPLIPHGPQVSIKAAQEYKAHLGLDKPAAVRYGIWLGNFIRFNWGSSLFSGRAVFPDFRTALWNSFILGAVATVFSLSIGISLGVYSALRQYSVFDYTTTTFAFVGLSMPTFWFALILQLFFGVYLTGWLNLRQAIFPVAGMAVPGTSGFNPVDLARHMVLPVIVISVQVIAGYSRYMRSSMLDAMNSDYLRTARAKGIHERRVVIRHAMRNALIPITTVVALDIGYIASGLIVTEVIFQWPGTGPFFLDAVNSGDYPQVLAYTMVTVVFVILFNLVADILYAFLDPRIRYA